LKQIQDAKMEEIKEMIALLIQVGFVDCGRYIFQRKTKNTNLIVAIRADTVEVSHGSPTIDHVYGYVSTDNLSALERLIAVATLTQIQTDGVHTVKS
jgi:hypothetical protein